MMTVAAPEGLASRQFLGMECLKTTDLQEAFNIVWEGLKGQGFTQSVHPTDTRGDGRPSCLYRAPDGKKCAAGHLIKDESYDPSIENLGIGDVISDYDHEAPITRLAAVLQRAHDQAYTPAVMEFSLRAAARQWGLTVPEEVAA